MTPGKGIHRLAYWIGRQAEKNAEEDPGLCKCGKPAGESDDCPYAWEIHDTRAPCSCCEACMEECADDV